MTASRRSVLRAAGVAVVGMTAGCITESEQDGPPTVSPPDLTVSNDSGQRITTGVIISNNDTSKELFSKTLKLSASGKESDVMFWNVVPSGTQCEIEVDVTGDELSGLKDSYVFTLEDDTWGFVVDITDSEVDFWKLRV